MILFWGNLREKKEEIQVTLLKKSWFYSLKLKPRCMLFSYLIFWYEFKTEHLAFPCPLKAPSTWPLLGTRFAVVSWIGLSLCEIAASGALFDDLRYHAISCHAHDLGSRSLDA